MKVVVTRPFMWGGARQELGATLDMPDNVARELAHMGKVAPAQAHAPVSGPMTTDAAASLVGGPKTKKAA